MREVNLHTTSPHKVTSYHLEVALYWCKELGLCEDTENGIALEILNMMISYSTYEMVLTCPKVNDGLREASDIIKNHYYKLNSLLGCKHNGKPEYDKHWYNKNRW